MVLFRRAPFCDFQASAVFREIQEHLRVDSQSYVKKLNGIYCFKIHHNKNEGVWIINLKRGQGFVNFDLNGTGEVAFHLSDKNFMEIWKGNLSPKWALATRKMKIEGNWELAYKLQDLQSEFGVK